MKSDPPDPKVSAHCAVCGGPLHRGPLGLRCPRCAFALAAEPEDLDEHGVRELFPELEVTGKVGRGGFGTVFRAEHRRLKRPVALKFLDPGLTHSPEAVARFEREMESVGRLDHPGIVRAYDAGERDGRWFMVMEYVDGEDLATLSRRVGPMDPVEACRILREAALALAYAHERGLVHRDVKPSNIMIAGTEGGVKVLDFGLAVTVGGVTPDHFSGTPDYAAPEQIATPGDVDVRADVFGLGATLFRLLTGVSPHACGGEVSLTERMERMTREPPPGISTVRKDLPGGLSQLVDRLVAMDRTERPATALAVADLLRPFCHETIRAHRFGAGVWLMAGLLALAVAGGWGLSQRTPVNPEGPTPGETVLLSILDTVGDGPLPRLLSREWELDSAIVCPEKQRGARFMRDGGLLSVAYRDAPDPQVTRWTRTREGWTGSAFALGKRRGRSWRAYIAPESGHILATEPSVGKADRLARYTPEGGVLPSLTYADERASSLESVAFVRAGLAPMGTPLRAGDVLVADAGSGPWSGRGSLWRCRLDSDEPLALLIEDPLLTAPVDLAVGQGGVYVFNRNIRYMAGVAPEEADSMQRVIRWDGSRLVRCRLSAPILDPSGLVADPRSGVLYAAEGSSLNTNGPAQRLLKLTPGKEPDTFEVEVIADRFGQLTSGALAIHEDGSLLAVTDQELARIFIFRRK